MKIKEFFEMIRTVFSDIQTDQNIYRQREDKAEKEYVHPKYEIPLPYARRGNNTGIFPFVVPHFIGTLIGFALARILNGTLGLYIVFGVSFAIALGTWKNMEYDKIKFTYALVRNLITFFFMSLFIEALTLFPIMLFIVL